MTDVWRIRRACALRESQMLRTTPIAEWPLVTADTAWHLRLCILRGEIVRVADRIRYRTGTGT